MNKRALFTSNRDDWKTPAWLINLVHEHFGEISFDMFANEENSTRALTYRTKSHTVRTMEGLKSNRLLWANPPYGAQVTLRCVKEWAEISLAYQTSLLLIPIAIGYKGVSRSYKRF